MNNIIKELVSKGINVNIKYNNLTDRLEYVIDGFYKSGEITLIESDDEKTFIAKARYDEITHIKSIRDLVELNHSWWETSKHKYEGWKSPDSNWLPLLLEYDLIKEKIIKTYE